MQKQNKKWLVRALVLFAVVILIIYYAHNEKINQVASVNAAQSTLELEAAKSVTVLPPGTEEAWDAYVDRRLAATLHRNGNAVQLLGGFNEMLGKTIFVSVNSPYEISCDEFAGSIKFGYPQEIMTCSNGEDAEVNEEYSVDVYDASINKGPFAEKLPPLGVNTESIAAEELQKRLCQRIADKMQSIMSLQPLPDGGVK